MKIMATVLEMAELDLDDDVILAIENGTHADLFEIYKINERRGPIEYNTIGAWSKIYGLELTNTSKWYRRGNLKVNITSFYMKKEIFTLIYYHRVIISKFKLWSRHHTQ